MSARDRMRERRRRSDNDDGGGNDEPDGPGGGVDLGTGFGGGGSDGDSGGRDPTDPSDAPSATPDPGGTSGGGSGGGNGGGNGGGRDPDNPADAPSATPAPTGGDDDSGGRDASDPADAPSATPDPGGDEDSGGAPTDPRNAPSATPAPGSDDGGRDAGDPADAPSATPDPGAAEQGVEASGDAPDRIVDAAAELEQDVVERYPSLDSSDVRVEREGNQLTAELTESGQAAFREEVTGGRDPSNPADAPSASGAMPSGDAGASITTQGDEPTAGARSSGAGPQGSNGSTGGSDSRDASGAIEGGDVRLVIEDTQSRARQQTQQTNEQFGDIAIENPITGNRVEEDLDNAADAFRDRASGVVQRTGTIGTPVGLAETRSADEVTEGLQGQVAESTIRLANVPQLAAEGKEVAEFAATQPQRAATEPREFGSDVQQRTTAIAETTAERAQDRPAEFAIGTTVGLLGAAGAGRAVGSATRRASGGRVDLGSDVSGRTAQRVSEATRRLGSSSRSAAGRATDAARGRTPEVSVERDPDAGLVEFEGDAPSLPSRPSASAVTDRVSGLRDRASSDTDFTQSARVQAAVTASTARRAASEAAETVRNAPGRAQVAASRARRRLGDLPADARLEAAAARGRAADAASSIADRARPSFDRDLSVDRPLSDVNLRDSARAQAAVATSSARRRLAGAVPSRPDFDSPDLDSPDVNLRQSAAAQAEVLAGSARRRAAAATEPIRNAPDRARIASDRAQRRLGDVRADAGLEAAAARARIRERLSSSRDGSALPSLDTPSLSGARDLTIRIGESDGPRRARVPDDTGDDLGPFADDDALGELGALDETDTSGNSGLVDGPDVDDSRGSSGGPSAVTLQRRGDADTPRPRGDREAGRRDRPRDLERGVASGLAADQVFGEGERGPSIGSGVGQSDAVGAAVDAGTAVGPTVETPTDIAPTETPSTDTGTGLDTPTRLTTDTSTRTGVRQDTDVRSDLRVDARADLDTRTDSRRRSNLDIDAPGSDDDGARSLGFGGDEQRFESDTLDLL